MKLELPGYGYNYSILAIPTILAIYFDREKFWQSALIPKNQGDAFVRVSLGISFWWLFTS